MATELDPLIEARALDETEAAMRELVQVGINCGMKPVQMVMMLRRIADEFEPKVLN